MQKVSKHHLLVLFGETSAAERFRMTQWLRKQLSDEEIARAYQLVDRNRITLSTKKILEESRRDVLRPFRFLIGKN
jgi:hypothetical protein